MKIGITSYGGYIPKYRMNRQMIFSQIGWFNPANAGVARGEKAVANYDEDAITLAYDAASNCLENMDLGDIEGMYLASMSLPFAHRQNAGVVVQALGLKSNVRSADFTGCLKSGTTALMSAVDAVASGNSKSVIACSSDSRVAKPGSTDEFTFGDGAAAILIGSENIVAEYKGSYSVSHDFIDKIRLTDERFDHSWEDRWIREEGFMKIIPQSIKGLCNKYEVNLKEFDKVIIACPNARTLKGIGKRLGLTPEQVQDNLVGVIGDTGTVMAPMMLIAALEDSQPGDKILVASYGYGCDVLYFEVTDEILNVNQIKKGLKTQIAEKSMLESYTKYQAYRNLIPLDMGIRGESMGPTALSELWRQGDVVSSLVGGVCRVCNTPQYPKQKVCVNPACGAIDQMDPYKFSDKKGTIISFTADYLAFSWDPPQAYGIIDFPEGGRFMFDFTDCKAESIKVGTSVEMTYRRKYVDRLRGYTGYYWKAKLS